jgi:LCP family protein required for cell wall assembly
MFRYLDDPRPVQVDETYLHHLDRRIDAIRHRRTRRAATAAVLVPLVGAALYVGPMIQNYRSIDRVDIPALGEAPWAAPETAAPNGIAPLSPSAPLPSGTATTTPVQDRRTVLIVGTDFLDSRAEEFGGSYRADTMIVLDIDPLTDQVSVLSLPRDLWVKRLDGTKDRLNGAVRDPNELVKIAARIIERPIDHYIELDMDGFVSLVDQTDGVRLRFDQSVRDRNTGLNLAAGCVTLRGESLLAYVRSRHLQVLGSTSGEWTYDEAGDLGRAARQRDVIIRGLAALKGLDLTDVRSALAVASEHVRLDDETGINELLDIADAARRAQPVDLGNLPVVGKTIDGKSVLVESEAGFDGTNTDGTTMFLPSGTC